MIWELANSRLAGFYCLLFLGELKEIAYRLPAYVEHAERLGDGLGAVVLQTCAGHVPKLLSDEPESALRVQQNAIEKWTPSGFHLPHLAHLIGTTEVDLYARRGDEAGRRIREVWPELKKSMLLVSHFFRARMSDLRARSALAAMSGAGARESKKLARTVSRYQDLGTGKRTLVHRARRARPGVFGSHKWKGGGSSHSTSLGRVRFREPGHEASCGRRATSPWKAARGAKRANHSFELRTLSWPFRTFAIQSAWPTSLLRVRGRRDERERFARATLVVVYGGARISIPVALPRGRPRSTRGAFLR